MVTDIKLNPSEKLNNKIGKKKIIIFIYVILSHIIFMIVLQSLSFLQ